MAKFFFFEYIVGLFYTHVFTAPKNTYAPTTQLGVTFASGYIAGVVCAVVSHPADSLVSLMPVLSELLRTKVYLRLTGAASADGDGDKESKEFEPDDRLVPTSWVLWGLAGSIVLGTVLVWAVFGDEGIKPWATLVGFVMGGLLSVLGYVPLPRPRALWLLAD